MKVVLGIWSPLEMVWRAAVVAMVRIGDKLRTGELERTLDPVARSMEGAKVREVVEMAAEWRKARESGAGAEEVEMSLLVVAAEDRKAGTPTVVMSLLTIFAIGLFGV